GKYYGWNYDPKTNQYIYYEDRHTWPYSTGCIATQGHYNPYTHQDEHTHDTKFGYGYYELRVMFPCEFNPHCFGDYFNAAWWLYDRGQSGGTQGGLDWSEIDFFEITNPDYQFSCNAHIREPFNYGGKWQKWRR